MQNYFDIRELLMVPPSAFSPRPKVDSKLIELISKEKPIIPIPDDDFIFRFIRACFHKRRKTIPNSLKASPYLTIPHDLIQSNLERFGFSLTVRGEQLSVEELGTIATAIYNSSTPY